MTVAGIANPIVQNYKYDSLYRLTEAEVKNNTTEGAGQNWIQQFQYDRYGNRTAFNQSIGAVQTTATPLIDPATNRFVTTNQNFRYDKNGNLTTDGDGRDRHLQRREQAARGKERLGADDRAVFL
ncbi:MAG: hypothetical protein IPJ30_09940 [Acidobacteria bacterium]|nr:hypothetical protein [Acidobacteriota bacterium]